MTTPTNAPVVHTIQLGATAESWTIVALQADGKYDPVTDKTDRPMYIICEGGVDGDYVDAVAPNQKTKVRASAAISILTPIGATTGGKAVTGNSGTYNNGWLAGHTMTASGGDDEFPEIWFEPMFVADASAVTI